ncbi:hypothetical protein JG687_00005954 [Phytophthora cactorum]|uniref:GIY-YIG domain-containing protein n=1 Tax=Phytophthora cactorum TaxID=29920 RepID=A0A8T1UKT7_9STRA|nr:hypothetical protein JG687_00005954 [Phytophthora cactorum]
MKGYIYKITNTDESIVYVGSTTQSIHRRWQMHLKDYRHFNQYGIDNFNIHLVSEHEIENRRELHEFEQLVIDTTNCVIRQAAILTEEQKRMKAQQYRDANKARLRAHASERIECDCGGSHRRSDKSQHARTKRHQQWLADHQ